ncbi:MAG: hypothetical protein ACRD0X_07585, partial [Thermoanaerobaculia bacterium]
PWVRRTCRRALGWGLGGVAVLTGFAWVLREPGVEPVARAFGVLAAYGLLFLATLAKIWWTAGEDAVVLADEALLYRPLHGFRPRRLELASVLGCGPRAGTQALRFVHRGRRQEEREFYLNLALIDDRHRFLEQLGERLGAAGLVPRPGRTDAWIRPGWEPW